MRNLSLRSNAPHLLARRLSREWKRLRTAYLPGQGPRSIWRQSRKRRPGEPTQGWKIHVSATVLSANRIFRTVAPLLKRRGILFKAPKSLAELEKLNRGTDYGFGLVGKFVTIYPPSAEAAVALAREIHRLTVKVPGPVIPYDNSLSPGSLVFYRYGSFVRRRKIIRGRRVEVIARPDGKLVPDIRGPLAAVPAWLEDPFRSRKPRSRRQTRLERDFQDFEALSQRGRGGIYRAVNISAGRRRPCIIKEGRRHGETDALGRDGFDKIREEARFLISNAGKITGLPAVMTTLRADNCFYLVMERMAGKPLAQILGRRGRISFKQRRAFCAGMARTVAEMHHAGWAWQDCKPGNFMRQRNGGLRPLDFEGVCRLRSLDRWPSATPGYAAPESVRRLALPEQADLYALGVSLAQVMTQTALASKAVKSFGSKAKALGWPAPLVKTVRSLLSTNPEDRPAARLVEQAFRGGTGRKSIRKPGGRRT